MKQDENVYSPAMQCDVFFSDDIKEMGETKFPAQIEVISVAVVLKGEACVSLNLKEYRLKAGNLLIILPNSILLNVEHSEDFMAHYLIIGREMIEEMSANSNNRRINDLLYLQEHPVTVLNEQEKETLLKYYHFMHKQVTTEEKMHLHEITYHLTSALFYEIARVIHRHHPDRPTPPSRQQEMFIRFLQLLKDQYKEHRSVSFYAEQLYIHPQIPVGHKQEPEQPDGRRMD